MKKIAFLTSGGDAPAMNATIRAVTRSCVYNNLIPVGVSRGFDGLINGDFIEMNARSVKGIINKGGTILKTARSSEFRTQKGREKAYNNLKKNNIETLLAENTMRADTLVNLDQEASEKVFKIMNFMDDLDDVQEVHTNAEFPEDFTEEE